MLPQVDGAGRPTVGHKRRDRWIMNLASILRLMHNGIASNKSYRIVRQKQVLSRVRGRYPRLLDCRAGHDPGRALRHNTAPRPRRLWLRSVSPTFSINEKWRIWFFPSWRITTRAYVLERKGRIGKYMWYERARYIISKKKKKSYFKELNIRFGKKNEEKEKIWKSWVYNFQEEKEEKEK